MEFKLNNETLFIGKDLVIDPIHGTYMRTFGSDMSGATKAICDAYGKDNGNLFPSGLSAIYTVLKVVCMRQIKISDDGVLLYNAEMYSDTETKILNHLSQEYPTIQFEKFNPCGTDDLNEKIKLYGKRLFVILTESASNPSSHIMDWNTINKPKNILLIIDNTWLTPINFNPFDYGADIVIDSCTKYLSAGKCLGGVAIYNGYKKLARKIGNMMKITGIHVSPINCALIKRGTTLLEQTVTSISNRVPPVLDTLIDIDNVDKVLHPSLPDHESYDTFIKYTQGYNVGTILFHIKCNNLDKDYRQKIEHIVEPTSIEWHTSYGKTYDLICRYCNKDETGVWLRLSVGYEENDNLLNDIKSICDEIANL
jgi:cystathionine beta-lyase/cystathionine gamma-synthase